LLVATIPLLLLAPEPLLLLVTIPHAHLLLRLLLLHTPTAIPLLHRLLPCLSIRSCTHGRSCTTPSATWEVLLLPILLLLPAILLLLLPAVLLPLLPSILLLLPAIPPTPTPPTTTAAARCCRRSHPLLLPLWLLLLVLQLPSVSQPLSHKV
jgi:hypothetical protein